MDEYFDMVEQRSSGVIVTLQSEAAEGAENGEERTATEEMEVEEKSSSSALPTPAKKPTPSPSPTPAAGPGTPATASSDKKKLDDRRTDLGETEENDTTRESDMIMLMHLPLIEAYFICFAPRQQPKVQGTLTNIENREEIAKKIEELEKSTQATPNVGAAAASEGSSVEEILQSIQPQSAAPAAHSEELSRFYSFTSKHRRMLNAALRQNKSLLSSSMRSLLWHPAKMLSFDIRRKYFKTELKKLTSKIKGGYGQGIKLWVRRDRIFEDSYQQMSRYSKVEDCLKERSMSNSMERRDWDAGGLSREWFLVLSRAIFNADNALFKPAADNPAVFQPNPESHINPDHLQFFHFAGRFVAKALIDNQRLDAYFTRSFYKHLLGITPSFPDVESVDVDKYRSLEWMLKNSIDHILFDTFSVETNEFGVHKTIDLIPNGRNIPVTDKNKLLYVHLVSDFILTRAIHSQLSAFLRGFHDLIPAQLISVFNEQEIELMICGLPDIDLADLKRHIEYRGFGGEAGAAAAGATTAAENKAVQWFWQIISEFNQQEKALLVLFVTGTSKIPLEGFKALQGANGITPFTLQKADGIDRLPLSHTVRNKFKRCGRCTLIQD
jgi:hypothetical protein